MTPPPPSGGGYLVPVEVRSCADDPRKGHGVFALAHIEQGTRLWEATLVRSLPADEAAALLENLPREEAQVLLRQSFVAPTEPGSLCINPDDNGRFTNHSTVPNVGACVDRGAGSYALRAIAAGEELTCDYAGFAVPPWYADLCRRYGVLTTAEVVALEAARQHGGGGG